MPWPRFALREPRCRCRHPRLPRRFSFQFRKATGILGGLWEKVRERPDEFLDRHIIETEGLDAATRDFLAGMTDRFAVTLYERLFIPKPWIGPMAWDQL